MEGNTKFRLGTFVRKTATTPTAVLLVLLRVLLFAPLVPAAQGDVKPTPPPGTTIEASPFEAIAPTTEELLAAPPSIERYVAAHTLPAGSVAAANLDDSTKSASDDSVSPNGVFEYTITVVNSGGVDIPVTMTDA